MPGKERGAMIITIDLEREPGHVRLRPGAMIRVGNNEELKAHKLGSMPGAWEVTYVYPREEGKQRYEVSPGGLNRRQVRALVSVQRSKKS